MLADWPIAAGTTKASVLALYATIVVPRTEERRRRRNDSLLGVIIIESLREEVRAGLSIMKEAFERISAHGAAPQHVPRELLPTASWAGISDAVLLRIIGVAHGVKACGFPPQQIRIYCKNYFVRIAGNVNKAQFDAEL
jgi:hypothetical protein